MVTNPQGMQFEVWNGDNNHDRNVGLDLNNGAQLQRGKDDTPVGGMSTSVPPYKVRNDTNSETCPPQEYHHEYVDTM